MKRFLILCLLLLCLVPLASATETWHSINQGIDVNGANWTANASGDAPSAYKAGDGDLGTRWNHYLQTDGAWITWNNPLGIYYSKVRIRSAPWSGDATTWTCNGVTQITPASAWINYSIAGSGPITCSNQTSTNMAGIWEIEYENGTPPAPIANFTAAPLNATAPSYVAFTDTSQNEYGTCAYNWSFTPSSGVIGSPGFLEQESPTAYFTEVGDYTVSHGVSCDAGSNISTKTDYIHILNTTGATSTCFAAIDALSGYQLSGANFQMYDIENTSWTNKTASSTGSECITTLSGHTINAYTDMLGYDDGELLAVTPRSSPDYPILMFPANATNVSAGNVTLYVTVRDMYSPGLPLSGAQVDMTYAFPATEQMITGASGMVSFVVPNQTTIYIAAQKAGYSGKSVSIDSGTGSGGDASISTTIYLPLLTVTPTITATTLPGGGTPAPTLTYLANCNPSASDYDAAKCRASHGNSGLNILAENLDILVWICIIVTIMYLLGIRLGG